MGQNSQIYQAKEGPYGSVSAFGRGLFIFSSLLCWFVDNRAYSMAGIIRTLILTPPSPHTRSFSHPQPNFRPIGNSYFTRSVSSTRSRSISIPIRIRACERPVEVDSAILSQSAFSLIWFWVGGFSFQYDYCLIHCYCLYLNYRKMVVEVKLLKVWFWENRYWILWTGIFFLLVMNLVHGCNI